MILALAIVLGLLVSLARHGRGTIEHISNIPLRSAWLALLALALQWPLLRAPFGDRQQVMWQQLLFLSSHLLLLVFVWRNRKVAGIRIVGLGVICNFLVIAANGGFMPISPETLVQINPDSALAHWPSGYHYGYSKDLVLLREETNLWALSDVLVLPPPFPWPVALSLGDLLIALGIVVLLQGPVGIRNKGAAVSEQAVADYR
jgi:hypothetical protein